MSNRGTFVSQLFDRDVYKEPAGSASFKLMPLIYTGQKLPKAAPDNPGVATASTPFMAGVLGHISSQVEETGFENGDPNIALIRWRDPAKNPGDAIYGRINLKEKKFEVSDMHYAGVTFAMLGVAAAYGMGHPAFKEAWSDFLNECVRNKNDALKVEAIGYIADILYGALVHGTAWPNDPEQIMKNEDGWTVTVGKNLQKHKVDKNLRAILGSPSEFESSMSVSEVSEADRKGTTRFKGEEILILKNFVRRRKHTALLGPPGTGKSLCAFETLALMGFHKKGIDFQLVTGHEEFKSSDAIGSYQPDGKGGFRWVNASLVRAMTGNGGRGMPLLIEEFTRMPTKSQNVYISALSDGYIVLNEKPGDTGDGEIVLAGPDFVILADMNVDPAMDDIELYGAAFASRVRKIEFNYPRTDMLVKILKSETKCSPQVAQAVSKTYDFIMKGYNAHEGFQIPMSPRSAVFWVEDYEDLVQQGLSERDAAQHAAKSTWLRDVCGIDEGLRGKVLNEIEAEFRKIALAGRKSTK